MYLAPRSYGSGEHISNPARFGLSVFAVLTGMAQLLQAADLEEAKTLLQKGEYSQCIRLASKAIDERVFGEDWYLIKTEAELQIGHYQEAFDTISTGLTRYAWSVRLRQAGIEPARMSDHATQAETWQDEIKDVVNRASWRYAGDADALVAIGKVAAAAGADPRQVLEAFYDRALKVTPLHRGAMLASGEMALSKKDFALAAETFQEALKTYPNDADLHLGLSRSLESTQPALAAHHLSEALRVNPRHIPTLLHKAQRAIDAEQYLTADQMIDHIQEINELHPLAWALQSVMAHLENETEREKIYRETALKPWHENPAVDHLIGCKLSQKYRFAEGSEHQRKALEFDPKYQPARLQLAQDLLRLGEEDEGWVLIDEANKFDGYDIQAFNLSQLHDQLVKYRTIEEDGFRIRMDPKEAAIYGDEALALLKRAKQTLCEKYAIELDETITIEILAEPNDFAVRTFGLPGANGYLGVCFGRVITANSPASLPETPFNWQSVLWHEFCHAVTLEKTRNRMPRWLSEGISVYEERQAGTTWGQRMSPQHRKRILEGRLTSVRDLSSAFLRPEKPSDLQFAYYQSSLLVEYLIQMYGQDSLKALLDDLAAGLHVNDAIERHTTSLDQIDMEFRDYAQEQARQLAPALDWDQYDLSAIKDDDDPDRLERWVDDHPNSIQGLTMLADQMVTRRELTKAKKMLAKLIELYPEQTGAGSAYVTLAGIHRELSEPDQERLVLEQYTSQTDDARNELLRLIDLQTKAEDWKAASQSVQRLLAVNPLLGQAQKARATASEHLGERDDAIKALQAWLLLDPDDLADAHYRLARLFHEKHDERAKAHTLAALEVAPRFRDAQKLLLRIVRETPAEKGKDQKPTAVGF